MVDVNKLVSVTPANNQIELAKLGFYAFIHFGINTFANKEWSDGTVPASAFNPTNLSTDNWCEVIKSAGMKAVILTAKHHDGFCLWQTDTTEYSVKNSPYKGGKGDIVRELKDSCEKYGLKLGLYLSPWDRNSAYYGTPKYNDFYIDQLTELLTRYGDIFELWLDGACGSYLDGKAKQVYDFERIYNVARKLQPNIIIANAGPDARWIGNEGGMTRESEWNVLPRYYTDPESVMEASQTSEDLPPFDPVKEDLGSREALEGIEDFVWYPAEVDVSIRPGWFYHESEDNKIRSVDNLLEIYYNSVGGNAMLLLNIPPNQKGLISSGDATVLRELGKRIESGIGTTVALKSISASQEKIDYPVGNLLKGGVYSPVLSDKYVIDVDFKEIKAIDKVIIEEDITHSQRIEKFEVYVKYRGKIRRVYKGTTVGTRKICIFNKWSYASGISIIINECRCEPFISKLAVCEYDGKTPKQHPIKKKWKKWTHAIGYKMYVRHIERENKKKAKKPVTENN